jgi:hypothetical protein
MIKKIAALTLFASLTLPHAASAQSFGLDYQEAASAILSAGLRASQVRALKSVPSVGVIYVAHGGSHRLGFIDENISTLIISSERNHAGILKLRAALSSNPATKQALSANGVAPNSVVGVQIGSNGSLRLFISK